MIAKIYSGATFESRGEAITQELRSLGMQTEDVLYVRTEDQKEHIGISQVRDFTRRMVLGPTVSQYMIGIIETAELLTVESQHALLKIIEEPPSHAIFLLGTPSLEALLPTIVSRCQHILIQDASTTDSEWHTEVHQKILELLDASPGAMISGVGSIAIDRISSKQWILEAIRQLHKELQHEVDGSRNINRLKLLCIASQSLTNALEEISVNVTPKLALEYAFLRIKNSQAV